MSESTIRAALYAIVNGTTNAGKCYDYQRWSADWSDFLTLFKTTISTVDQIRGWLVVYNGFEAAEPEQMDPGGMRAHRYTVRGILGLDDSAATEKTMAALAETICNNLDDNAGLHNGVTYYDTSRASIGAFEPRVFGGVLCHYVEITLTVTEWRA